MEPDSQLNSMIGIMVSKRWILGQFSGPNFWANFLGQGRTLLTMAGHFPVISDHFPAIFQTFSGHSLNISKNLAGKI